MLYKSELATIPLLEVEQNCQVSAEVVALEKSGRVLVCDFVCNGQRNRFFTDGKSYLTRKAGSTTYSQCYPTDAYALEDSKGSRKIAEAFLNERGSVTWAVKSFVGRKKWAAAQRSSDRKWELEKQHFAMFPKHPTNLAEYCENHVFQHGYIFVQKKDSMNQLIVEYRDYIKMSQDLGVDLSHKSVRYPADVVEAHKVITDRYNLYRKEIEQRKNAEVDRKFHERVQALYQQFGITDFASGSYCIAFPQLRSDLIVEGQSLNHCVGQTSYYENHMRGTKMIFFVREQSNPERPFFTMELDMSTFKILQLYGFGDCTAPKDVRAFAEKFAQRLMRSMYKKTA